MARSDPEKLAQALRANLRRRKSPTPPHPPEPATAPEAPNPPTPPEKSA